MSAATVFRAACLAIQRGVLIRRSSAQDKEFHFQNWVGDRLTDARLEHETGGRNQYPDFRLVRFSEGYEVKGLAYPGREASYDSNSQVPTGLHNGRAIYYVFGRYPKGVLVDEYPVLDLVICHGDFLNATHDYVHRNRSLRGFGSYGDIMIRDRKMYVCPTPFALTTGTLNQQTLILPGDAPTPEGLREIGRLTRREADNLIIGYEFDLTTNSITPHDMPNPSAGREHHFRAFRLAGSGGPEVALTRSPEIEREAALIEAEEESEG